MILCTLTFGGMWRWRRVAVARVFALVVRCRIMRLLLYSRVGKNRDTSGGPRREPGQPVPPSAFFHFDQKILAAQKPMTYTDLLCPVIYYRSILIFLRIFNEFNRIQIIAVIIISGCHLLNGIY